MRVKQHAKGLAMEMDPRRILVLLLVGMALASGYLTLAPIVDQAGSASSRKPLNPYEIQGDRFSNYDFLSEEYDRDNVDWAVDLIFAHGGAVNRVKSQLDDPFDVDRIQIDPPGPGSQDVGPSPMWARVNDGPQGSGGEWDEDSGRKTRLCQSKDDPNVFHYRIYAPDDTDYFFNQKWGNYSIATAHIDHNECAVSTAGDDGSPKWAGRSERAERIVAYHSSLVFENARVYPDKVWLRNWERSDMKVSHWWTNDGKATFIDVTKKARD